MSRRGDKNGDIKLRGQFIPVIPRDEADASMEGHVHGRARAVHDP